MADPHWGPVAQQPEAYRTRKKHVSRRRRYTIRALKAVGIVTALGLISMVAIVFIGYRTTDRPDPNADFETATTFVYYNDGKSELGTFAVQNRQPVESDQIAENMKQADRRRGEPHVLDRQGHLDPGHDPGRLDHRPRRQDPGRIDDHSAVHQDPLSHLRSDPDPQVPRAVPGVQDQQGNEQGRDPRGLPEHDLLRARRVRDPGGQPGLLQDRRQRPHGAAICVLGHRGEQSEHVRPVRRGQHRAPSQALSLRDLVDGRDRLPDSGSR